ncbi:MAG: hypothetical protein J6J60_03250 [Clostridia bacterium]|nr:hypothetical protein [Clostridia bacterium]
MSKKIQTIFIVCFVFVAIISFCSNSYANTDELLETDTTTELLEMKESTKEKLDGYIEQYGSTAYGIVAYILNTLRIFSIPFGFLGIAYGVIKQYVTGIRRIDIRDRGFYLIIIFVTLLLICQVLPLIFAIVVHGWRG